MTLRQQTDKRLRCLYEHVAPRLKLPAMFCKPDQLSVDDSDERRRADVLGVPPDEVDSRSGSDEARRHAGRASQRGERPAGGMLSCCLQKIDSHPLTLQAPGEGECRWSPGPDQNDVGHSHRCYRVPRSVV